MDGSVLFKSDEDAFFREILDDVVGKRRRKPINLDPKPVNLNFPVPKRARPFAFSTFDDAIAQPASKPWLIKGLLAQGETSGWIGPPGSLKSAILTSVAIAVSSGEDFCGKRCKGKFSVIYFALERADLVRRRLHAHHKQNGVVSLPIAVVGHVIDLMSQKTVDLIVATIDEVGTKFGLPVGLIIFDTYPKGLAAGGGDEDRARDQGVALTNLQRIKDLRHVHIALVGHPGKDKTRGARGSNAWLGDVDVMIEIDGTDIRTATVTKTNDMAEGPIGSFRPKVVELGVDEDGDPIEVSIAVPVPVDFTPAVNESSQRDLTPAAKIALQALIEAVVEVGETPPASNHIPAGVRTVTVKQWRQYAYLRGISTGEARAKEKAFERASEQLLSRGKISRWDETVWIVS
jgi:AAA domain